MTEEMRKHYEAVFEDLMVNGPNMFQGIYDASHGEKTLNFMFGIQTVLEYIAVNVSEQRYIDFSRIFAENVMSCQEKCLTK